MIERNESMNIAIIDADLIYRTKHRFPNLACMKISAYYKSQNHDVHLKLDYENLDQYDKVFISKVFTDTLAVKDGKPCEFDDIISLPNVEYGGTGFFYDKAPKLPDEIEHIKPDYHLYDDWVNEKINEGASEDENENDKLKRIANRRKDFVYYLDYSIGFLTRGCFRQCEFCVNKNYKKSEIHSSVFEFMDESRPKLCFLDDNFLACSNWRDIITDVKATGKKFQFKQGLDERLLTDEKTKELMSWKYDGDYIFAFDNIADRDTVEEKAILIRKYNKKLGQNVKFYVLCGFDRNDKYDEEFWINDINDTFDRIFILAKYNFKPYIMRFEKYKESPLYGTYVNLARWCNQPSFFNNHSYEGFCLKNNENTKDVSATWKYYEQLSDINPECKKYFRTIPKDTIVDYSNW
jgi:hypothetical protein